MSGIHKIELSPASWGLFDRHIHLIVLKCPADQQKFVNDSLLGLEITGNSL